MTKEKWKLVGNIALLVGIFIVISQVLKNSMGEIFLQLKATPFWLVGLVLILGLLYQWAEGVNVYALLPEKIENFGVKDGFFASCYAAFMRVITFGAGTIVAEMWYYRKKKLAISQSVGLVSLRMILYKGSLFVWSLVGLLFLGRDFFSTTPSLFYLVILGMGLTILIIGALLSLSCSLTLQIKTVKLANRWLKKPQFRKWFDQLNLQIYPLRAITLDLVKDRQRFQKLLGWNLVKLSFWLVIPYVVLVWEHPELGFWQSFFYTAFSIILAGVIPTPAGIGSLEFVFTLIFKSVVGSVDAISALLLYRFASYVLPFLIGLVKGILLKKEDLKEEMAEIKLEKEKDNS